MAERMPVRTETVAEKFQRFYALLDEREQAALRDVLEQAFADPSGAGLELFDVLPPSASLSDIWGPPRVVPVGPRRARRISR